MSSIKETMEQFAGLYKELENNRFQAMIKSETARFNEIISEKITDVLVDLIEKDSLKEEFVVEVMSVTGLHIIFLKTPLEPFGAKKIEFDSMLPLEVIREELKKAYGEEETHYDGNYHTDVYTYTFNFPKIVK